MSCENKCSDCDCDHDHKEKELPKIDPKTLGPEAIELDKMFKEVHDNLLLALQARKNIHEYMHKNVAISPEMKEKLESVARSQHGVVLQFVFGE